MKAERKHELTLRVNLLFTEMQSLKPLLFRHSWPSRERLNAAKTQYMAVREFRQLTDAQFKFGLDRLRATMKYPSAPSEFLELCRNPEPEALGAPSRDEAYAQVLRYETAPADRRDLSVMHPATYWAWRQMNHSVWRKLSAERHEKAFYSAYQRAMKAALAGEKFPAPPKQLAGKGGDMCPEVAATDAVQEQRLQARILQQGIPAGVSARQQLLSSLGIKRGDAKHA
ncbi:replication protein P [Ectopseudomonas mendocina]|uniref:Replication protein P n=1 Tax=Ectopseudomonas mendocina TaxID=300 RepID=A0ABZ2RLU2_ECTME